MTISTSDNLLPSTLISVVIPTLNESATIASTLNQLLALAGNWEIIVADSGSSDGTPAIANRVPCVRVVDVPQGRGVGMNGGAAIASGAILLFLHADTRLPSNAFALITAALGNPRTSATAFHLRFDSENWRFRFLEIVSRVRIPTQRTFFGDQAIAVRREDFQRVGGYGEAGLMEDIELSRKLRRMGHLRVLPAHVTTSPRRFERGGVVRTLLFMGILQIAYFLRVPGDRLARWYAEVR